MRSAFLFSTLAIVIMAGCQHYATTASPKPAQAIAAADEQAAKISEPLIRAEVRRDAAAGNARHIVDLNLAPAPTLYAKAIADSLAVQKGDIQEARQATEQVRADLSTAQTQATKSATVYTELRAEWYVVWGLRIEHAWIAAKWIIGLAALAIIFGGILKDTPLAATPWGIVAVLIYRVGITVCTGCTYPFILAGRWLLNRWTTPKAVSA